MIQSAFERFKGINEDFVLHIRNLLESNEDSFWIEAAREITLATNKNVQEIKIDGRESAEHIIRIFLHLLLERDQYEWAALLLWGPKVFNPGARSVKMILNTVRTDSKILIIGAGSMGKCMQRNTLCLMYDGSTKNVQDIKVGDLLMGDDSTPRTVLHTTSGRSKMYKITNKCGQSWTCNKDHILSLRCNHNKWNNGGKSISSTYTKGNIIDIPVEEFIGKSKQFKEYFRQYITGVEFLEREIPFDPYIFGLWLGDGTTSEPCLSSPDNILKDCWVNYFQDKGFRVSRYFKEKTLDGRDFECLRVCRDDSKKGHAFIDFLRTTLVNGKKRIPREYLINSRENRLKLLAGLIDTDGSVYGPGVRIATVLEGLKEDIIYLARSLGFLTSFYYKESVKAWVITLFGDFKDIPTKLKFFTDKKRETTDSCITVEDIGEDEYFGFSVDGNHRFLLGDFTVTHNSYSIGVWTLLDWLKDPHYTAVRIISSTAAHAKTNLFSHICELHSSAVIKLDGSVMAGFIGLDEHKRKYAISQLSIPQGRSGKGRLRGLHPDPRPKEFDNPKYNGMARIRIILDEAEEIPDGIWEDISNILLTKLGPENIKVIAATNPKNPASEFGKRAEPESGWQRGFDLETSEVWTSTRGWKVLRLDGAKCENVITGKDIYPGLLTKEGYEDATKDAGGVGTPTWYTMCRGAFPVQGSVLNIISPAMLGGLIGRFNITYESRPIMAGDLALEGGDQCVLAYGRVGPVVGFTPNFGKYEAYEVHRRAIQCEQLFYLPRNNAVNIALEIKKICKNLNVSPRDLMLDRTGNGAGVHDYLKETWNGEVKGVNYAWKATDLKILAEDSYPAIELYDGIVTELWFALQKFIEFEYLKISPIVDTSKLFTEIIARKTLPLSGSTKIKVEPKSLAKASLNGKSPDTADALTLLVHLARTNGYLNPSMQKNIDVNQTNLKLDPNKKVSRFDKLTSL